MQSRRDQVQAYFFVVGRLISALMQGRPDEPTTPTRRFVMGTVIGTLIGCLVVAGFGVYGLIKPGGNTTWQQAGAIIVEKETGARYLYMDGKLRPVLNYSSALLAAKSSSGAQVKLVSQNSLKGAPRATPIGIPDAPDSLPDAESISSAPWVVCASTETAPDGSETPMTDLQVRTPIGKPLADDKGVLVSTPDGAVHLVWQGKKLRMPGAGTMNALAYGNERPFPVTAEWINTLPSGPDLVAPKIPGSGQPAGLTVNGEQALIGQVFEVRNQVLQDNGLYVLREDGFMPLNYTLAALLLNDPDNAAAYAGRTPELIPAGMDLLNSKPLSPEPTPAGFPITPPNIQPVSEGSSTRPCAVFQASRGNTVKSEIGLVPREEATGSGQAPADGSGAPVADRITVAPNSGVLARDLPAPGVGVGTLYLVSNVGVKYPLPSPDVAGVLGYSASSAVSVPSALLSLLPTGPSLDPAQALSEQPVSAEVPAATAPN
ncbi:type VII secretion protein EccB [Saccharopolyspora gloriosae]|uniref:type VII secretion protein EccB n=1 Tax=Saccharopolyspora gloriosae TaxID=455344 RepID=UPI001FB6D0CE|nr:type VII secretion protein EccB [Saccharopolyspora gloriosae]